WTGSRPRIVGLACSALRQESRPPAVPLSPLRVSPSCDTPSSRYLIIPLPLRLERRNNEARSTERACSLLNGGKEGCGLTSHELAQMRSIPARSSRRINGGAPSASISSLDISDLELSNEVD